MSKNIRTQLGKVIGKSLNSYHARVKPIIDDIKFKEQYQGRIIDCMVGEVDDNYIETPETDAPIVKLEHSKEGLVKVPSIKGKTILVDVDGNETDTPAEGCRLVSVGEEEDNKMIILSKNKNLFDGMFISGNIHPNGEIVSYADRVVTPNYLKIDPNTPLFIHGFDNIAYICYYDSDKNVIVRNTYSKYDRPLVHNVPSNAMYIRISIVECTDTSLPMMVEQGSSTEGYIEPKHHKTEILLDEPLRSLSDEVCDKVVGNNLVRKTKKVLITENDNMWLYENKQEKNTIAIGINNALINDWYRRLAKSNIFNRAGSVIFDQEGFSHGDSGASVFIRINKERLPSENLAGFKNWLSENPIEIIYELEEPIIEELPNGITLQGFDDTTMYIENSIVPTISYGYNALIPYKEELSKQKEEVETNTLDIEQNIIPYLMDMEFNLMLMEDNE